MNINVSYDNSYSKFLLYEAYEKVSLQNVESLLNLFLKFVQDEKYKEAYFLKALELRFCFEDVNDNIPDDSDLLKNRFDPNFCYGCIIFPIKKSFINILQHNESIKKDFIKRVEYSLTHEDTHKQQFDKYRQYNINYKKPSSYFINSKDLSKEDIEYFSQAIEADAYGRQIGEQLYQKYKNLNAKDIFKKITNNEIDDKDITDIIDVYRSTKISRKAYQSFFRTLYDYICEKFQYHLKETLNIMYELDVRHRLLTAHSHLIDIGKITNYSLFIGNENSNELPHIHFKNLKTGQIGGVCLYTNMFYSHSFYFEKMDKNSLKELYKWMLNKSINNNTYYNDICNIWNDLYDHKVKNTIPNYIETKNFTSAQVIF